MYFLFGTHKLVMLKSNVVLILFKTCLLYGAAYIYMHKYMCSLHMQGLSESQSHPCMHQKCKSTLMMV